MAVCNHCGEEFDYYDAESYFDSSTWLLSYSNLNTTLCGPCAVKAVTEDLEDGIYYETCERCGCSFDFVIDNNRMNGSLRDYWNDEILCADCAISDQSN